MKRPGAATLSKLLTWYRRHGRRLPWRETTDAYAILVSEIMLQQTQVSRVVGYYKRWMSAFPDWQALVSAPPAQVIRAWSGLGYNRRALALHAIAKHVVKQGEPSSRGDWLAMKGVGPYTSAALAVFSLRQPVLPVDTNVRRVLGRLYLSHPYPKPSVDRILLRRVEPLLKSVPRFYDVPQAIFDLANSYCTKKPLCQSCPLRQNCGAAKKFLTQKVRAPKRTVQKPRETVREGKRYPDRIYRGRILRLVQGSSRPVTIAGLGEKIDPSFKARQDAGWLSDMVHRLKKDGLIAVRAGRLYLP